MSEKRDQSTLVKLGEKSDLKTALNTSICLLEDAENVHLRPHVCLNKTEGIEVLRKIFANPETADTQIMISTHLIHGGSETFWLNIQFVIFLDRLSIPNDIVSLTPRQTSFVVKNLPEDFQKMIIEKVKTWYFESFMEYINKGFDFISKQFKEGDPLLEDDHRNRIFDIRGGRYMELHYTELPIIGEELFWALLPYRAKDSYERMDMLIQNRR